MSSVCISQEVQASPDGVSPPTDWIRGIGRPGPTILDYGVEVRFGQKSLRIDNVTGNHCCAALAVTQSQAGKTCENIAIVSLGHFPATAIDPAPLDFFGDDPGECILFINLETGAYERVSYHQMRPCMIALSPDGKHVAFASIDGWVPTRSQKAASPPPEIRATGEGLTKDEILQFRADREPGGIDAITVGTMLYSIWELNPIRPVWEMRHYENHSSDAAQTASFVRPWSAYARVALPWWSHKMSAEFYKNCRIGFSRCSKYFVALDQAQGIHVLRMSDGEQFHCCSPTIDRRPATFFFEGTDSVLSVLWTDRSLQKVSLETGEETEHLLDTIPPEATFTSDNGVTRMLFSVNTGRGIIGTHSREGTFRLFLQAGESSESWVRTSEILKIGSARSCRIDLSKDGQKVGIGFNRHNDHRDTGEIVRYDLADIPSGRVQKRLQSRLRTKNSTPYPEGNGNIPTITIESSFAASLSPDGTDIIYAVPVQSQKRR